MPLALLFACLWCIGSWEVMPFSTIHDAAEPLGFLLQSGDANSDALDFKAQIERLTGVPVRIA